MAIFWIRISKKLTNYRELASASTNETLTEIRTVRVAQGRHRDAVICCNPLSLRWGLG